MKSFLISDNRDTWVGMRLAGINGIIIHEKDELLEALNAARKDEEIGLIIMTEKIVDLAKDEIMEFKLKVASPLIIEIPDRHGTMRSENAITNYIRESVGIRI
ncbi:MAG: V-type ATP synthase subunit F [Candidatus Niameybacter stercoravium]|nr:V-type ATP synthase subunit F [Candidatus Niameybacter stercoravium]